MLESIIGTPVSRIRLQSKEVYNLRKVGGGEEFAPAPENKLANLGAISLIMYGALEPPKLTPKQGF